MKKLLFLSLILIFVLVGGGAVLVGVTPTFIIYGPGAAAGIGSKLLCSSEYVSGFSREQAFSDLVQYSSFLSALSVTYNEEQRSVSASLLGLGDQTATYIPGLGCAERYPGYTGRQAIEVQAVPSSTAAWPAGDTVATIEPGIQEVVEELVAQDNEEGLNTRALLVVHDGAIVAETYAQEATADTPMLGWSMAKSLIAVMLGNLEMRGMLDLNAPPGFPEWSDDERARIRTSHLLHMTGGLAYAERYRPGGDATVMLFTSPSMSDYAVSREYRYEPGTRFNYSSATANLLGRLHQNVLGGPQQAYDDFMENIYGPMGFQGTVFEMDASGTFASSSYVYSTARDWARMGQLMLNDGELNGNRLVTRDWVRRATTPNNSANRKRYGFQWWLNYGDETLRFTQLPADMYYASGNRRQYVMVVPSANAVFVRLGWTAGLYPTDDRFSRLLDVLD
ncbi:MAG: serine hydrolase [Pseudohongiellaceae bacterium]